MPAWPDIRLAVAGKRDHLVASLGSPEEAQWQLLQRILKDNASTDFGTRRGLGNIRGWEDFQLAVPLQTYEELRSDVEAMMAGKPAVLCAGDVQLFEQTGGSTGASKYLPFTAAGLNDLRAALYPWLDDLLTARPGIQHGSAYWSISPATRQESHTAGGTPIGIGNDAAYFGPNLAAAIAATLAVPSSVASIANIEAWRHATLCHLLACSDLSFISVWSPTFLLQLLDGAEGQLEAIVAAIADGLDIGGRPLRGGKARAKELRRAFAADEPQWQQIWPQLDTISCWCSASSRQFAGQLHERFPDTHIQGKGLLATEGVVTIPLAGAPSPVLAINSGVFEFLAADGQVFLPWELMVGQTYSIVMTTAAGLYRYRLGDSVVVKGYYEATPCLEFIGREASSDLCGEKLTEAFVDHVLKGIPGFRLLVPCTEPQPGYLLLLDATLVAAGQEAEIGASAERELMANPQYRYARELGQLSRLEARRIADPLGTHQRICVQSGQRLGDIKISALARPWWGERYLVDEVAEL